MELFVEATDLVNGLDRDCDIGCCLLPETSSAFRSRNCVDRDCDFSALTSEIFGGSCPSNGLNRDCDSTAFSSGAAGAVTPPLEWPEQGLRHLGERHSGTSRRAPPLERPEQGLRQRGERVDGEDGGPAPRMA